MKWAIVLSILFVLICSNSGDAQRRPEINRGDKQENQRDTPRERPENPDRKEGIIETPPPMQTPNVNNAPQEHPRETTFERPEIKREEKQEHSREEPRDRPELRRDEKKEHPRETPRERPETPDRTDRIIDNPPPRPVYNTPEYDEPEPEYGRPCRCGLGHHSSDDDMCLPSAAEVLKLKALAYYEQELYNSALYYFTKAIDECPECFELYFYRGLTYLKLEEYELAIKDLDVYMKFIKDNKEAYYARGMANFFTYEREKAFWDFQNADYLGEPKARLMIKKYY